MAITTRHVARTSVDDIAVVVHDEHPPSEAEWSDWLEELQNNARRMRAILIYSLGGGPSSRQRAAMHAVLQEIGSYPAPFLLTSSVIARGMVTAVNWLLPEDRRVRVFAADELDRALDELRVSDATRRGLVQAIDAQLALLGHARAVRRAG